jgi:hypothetical protein
MHSQPCSLKLAALVLGSLGAAFAVLAQDPQEPPQPDAPTVSKPKPAARGIPAINDPNSTVEGPSKPPDWQPDNGPATGMQVPGIGAPELGHSYWVPGLQYGSTIQSRTLGPQTSNGWYANNYVGANLSLLEAWSRAQLGVNYSGGGFFSTEKQTNNGTYQQVSLGNTINLSRMQIQFFDHFSYIPDSQFGFAGGTNLALPGISGTLGPAIPGLGVSVIPTQSIYNAVGPRYSNAFAAQSTYSFSRRSSVTFGGSYGFLHFTQAGNVDYDMALGSAGYNYAINKNDSIGVLYRFTAYHYAGEPQALGNHVANVVYVKKISQRLALSLFGGPQITTYRVPIGGASQQTNFSGGATFQYRFAQGDVTANYFHGLNGGAGVLVGSNADLATATISHEFGRVWSGFLNFGYSRNRALGSTAGLGQPTYDDWFAGGGVNRPFGRNVNLALAYSARFENTSASGCVGTGCNTDYIQNMVSVTLQWHTRPFVLP